MSIQEKGWKGLLNEVIDANLCTLCGACVNNCPYFRYYNGKIAAMDDCNRPEGGCYETCPRTLTDLDELNRAIFGKQYDGNELGTCKEIVIARSTDESIIRRAQYGGTVTALLLSALENGFIDEAVSARISESQVPEGRIVHSKEELLKSAGSSYLAYPALDLVNRTLKDSDKKLGIVGTPCQSLALAKIKFGQSKYWANTGNIGLVIGLFCTWALSPDKLQAFLASHFDLNQIRKCDVPPPPANTFDVYTESGCTSFPLNEIKPYIMPACSYCFDMTAEFADISVGSAEGIPGWNTVIIRSDEGSKIMEKAVKEGRLELGKLPPENLEHLKTAALNKKKRAFKAIVDKTKDHNNLLYIKIPQPVKEKLLD